MRTELNAKQARFVQEYLVDGNGARAAVAAGYGRAGSRVAACRLLTNNNVLGVIQARQREDEARLRLDRNHVLEGLLEAVARAREGADPGAMIAGWREIGRLMGFYAPERVKTEFRTRPTDRLEQLSDAELTKIINARQGTVG